MSGWSLNGVVCLFVYFHQLLVTMNNHKAEGSNRDKTMKKQKLKEKFTPFDDDIRVLIFAS